MCEKDEKVVNYSELSFDEEGTCDNSVIMLLKLLQKLEVQEVALAGFDGYQVNGKNYVAAYMTNKHTKGEVENIKLKKYMRQLKQQMQIRYLTKSLYQE
jgi:IS1 family transposase